VAVSPDESSLTVIANRRRDFTCATSIGDDGDADLQPRPLAEEAEKSGGSLTPALLRVTSRRNHRTSRNSMADVRITCF